MGTGTFSDRERSKRHGAHFRDIHASANIECDATHHGNLKTIRQVQKLIEGYDNVGSVEKLTELEIYRNIDLVRQRAKLMYRDWTHCPPIFLTST
jgi:hypothetical protein